MADGNNPNQKNENQKPGLSWTQPAQNASGPNKGNTTANTSRPGNTQKNSNDSAAADSTARVIGIIIGIVVIFALAAWGIVALHNRSNTGANTAQNATSTTSGSDTNATSNTDNSQTSGNTGTNTGASNTQTASQPTTAGGASFTVPSPQAAGATVNVDNLNLSAPTWVIVYDDDNGKPGNILGATLLFPTDKSGLVYLLRATIPGTTYLASAAVDNGDKAFNLKDESVVTDSSGQQMWITFQTR